MRLPRARWAIIEQRKILGYLLSLGHPIGAAKCRFLGQIGFQKQAWHLLVVALRSHALENPCEPPLITPWGLRFVVRGPLRGPNGDSRMVRVVWELDRVHNAPRLLTMVPEGDVQ
jgi:hypothetical protein